MIYSFNVIRFDIIFRPETERYIAEKFGIGVMTDSTFTLKEHLRDDIHKMCLPKIMQNEIKGIITHVKWVFFDKKSHQKLIKFVDYKYFSIENFK